MNEMTIPIKFMLWVLGVVSALGLTTTLGKTTFNMAVAAIEAQQKDQMSYGQYSRLLWSQGKKAEKKIVR